MLTTASTAALKDHRAKTSAPVWQRLADAGAICIAKSNMPEVAAALNGYNPLHGHCWNAHGIGFSSGGSSSGTAAGIAAGMAPCGLGSDTAGSLRIPADRNGITGLRPSLGRYPGEGCVPLIARVDTPGPMGLTCADVALIDHFMSGEPAVAPAPQLVPADLSGLKVCTPSAWIGANLSPGSHAALDLAVAALEGAGATVGDDKAGFAAFTEKLEEKTSFFEGRNTTMKAMDAYLARDESGITTADVCKQLHWSNALLGFVYQSEGAREIAGMSEEDYQTKYGEPHKAAKEELEAAYLAFLDDTNVEFMLTPCNNCAPENWAKVRPNTQYLSC